VTGRARRHALRCEGRALSVAIHHRGLRFIAKKNPAEPSALAGLGGVLMDLYAATRQRVIAPSKPAKAGLSSRGAHKMRPKASAAFAGAILGSACS